MSTQVNFSDFAATLQAAQAAIDNAPKLEQERDAALHARDEAQRHAEALELTIQSYRKENDKLQLELREAEAARDTFRKHAEDNASQRDRIVQALETAVGMVQDEVRQIIPQQEPPQEPELTPASEAATQVPINEPHAATSPTVADPEPTKYTSWGSVTDTWYEWKRRQPSDHVDDGKPQSQSTGYGEERKSYTGF